MDMPVKALTTKAEQAFAEHYEAAKTGLPGAGTAWIDGLRAEAMRRYSAAGLPHRRVEAWKFTDLRAHLSDAFAPTAPAPSVLSQEALTELLGALGRLQAHRIVLVDGRLDAVLSRLDGLPEGVRVTSLAEALAAPPDWLEDTLGRSVESDDDAVLALNAALMSDGVVLRVPDGAAVEQPIHIVHVQASDAPGSVATRNVVSIGRDADATLLESHVAFSQVSSQRNTATELLVGDGATVRHLKDQREAAGTTHLSNWLVRIGAGAAYRAFQFSTGAALARNQINVAFAGEGASLDLSGAFLARGRQHIDTTLIVDHAVPGCKSRELFKGVLDDDARGVFQGKIIVQPDAQKSDGKQMAQALLLSESAEFDAKPELEIFADDVVCGHGATTGKIDEDLLFYLRARGIPEQAARGLLILAFVGEALELVEDEAVREALLAAAEDWLSGKDT